MAKDNIFKRMEEREKKEAKEPVSFTLDSRLVGKLRDLMRQRKRKLSPSVNLLLWDWIKSIEKEDDKIYGDKEQ